jgi:hypothetical protein
MSAWQVKISASIVDITRLEYAIPASCNDTAFLGNVGQLKMDGW